jgi:tetratricopeptide (TPR) repeat protein
MILFFALTILSCGGSSAGVKPDYVPAGPVQERILTEARVYEANAFDQYENRDYQPAIGNYQTALRLLTLIDNQQEIALVRHNMANVLIALHNHTGAENEIELSLRANRSFEYPLRIAANLASLGTIYEARSDLDKALSYYSEALDLLLKNRGSANMTARQYNNCGYILLKQKKYDEAKKQFDLALSKAKSAYAHLEAGAAYSGIGKYQFEMKQMDLALRSFGNALIAYKAAESSENIAISLKDLALTYEAQGDTGKAIDHTERAYNINRMLQLENRWRQDLDVLIRLHTNAGNTARAEEYRRLLRSGR